MGSGSPAANPLMSRKTLIIAAILLTAALAALWFARRPIYAAIKEWRAGSLVSKAERLAEEGEPRSASQAATAAWQLNPKRIETVRRLIKLGRRGLLADLPGVTLILFFHEDRDPADREDILKWTLDRGDPAFFEQLYPSLDEATRKDPGIRLLHARKLALQGRFLESVEEARALEVDAPSEENSLLIAEVLPRLPGNPVAARQARDRIVKLMESPDEAVALRAWRLLTILPADLRDPGPDFDPTAWLAKKSTALAADRVAAARLEVSRLPAGEQAEAIRSKANELAKDLAAMPALVRWCLENERGIALLDLPETSFLADPAVFSARLQVLLETERYSEAKAFLAKAPAGFPESVAGSLTAVFLKIEGRSSESVSAWRRVLDRASSLQVYSDCLSILRVAERFGEEEVAENVVKVIVAMPGNRLPPSESLEFLEPRFAERQGEWLAFWRGLLRFRGNDPIAGEQVAFLELGVSGGIDPQVNIERTGKALQRYPSVPRFRATHALWLLRENRNQEAMDVLRDSEINWNEADPQARTAYIIALLRLGARSDAESLARSIPWQKIGPVRRSILQALLTEAAGSPS